MLSFSSFKDVDCSYLCTVSVGSSTVTIINIIIVSRCEMWHMTLLVL